MGKTLSQFNLLMWKNWKLQYRRPVQTIVEILAPVVFTILLVMLRSLVQPEDQPSKIYTPFSPIPPLLALSQVSSATEFASFLKNYTLIYSPSPNPIIDSAMEPLTIIFRNVRGYPNGKKLEEAYLAQANKQILAGIQFDDDLYNQSTVPKNLKVALRFPAELRKFNAGNFLNIGFNFSKNRTKDDSFLDKLQKLFEVSDWKTNLLFPMFESPGPRDAKRNTGAAPNYFTEGFLALQTIITSLLILPQMDIDTYLKYLTNEITPPSIQMQRFPYYKWKDDPLLPAMISFIGILIMLSFVYTCINTVKVITVEKEKQLKEAMKIMGLPNWLHWTAWFIKALSFLLISMISITVLMCVRWYPNTSYSIFTFANPIILFIFLFFYSCATITFCFSVSVFFSKANTAATVAGLLWFLSYSPFLFLQTQYDSLSLSVKLLTCLGSNTAMAYGFQMFLLYEGTNQGIHWNNIWKPSTPNDNLSLGLVLVMLAVDTLIYLCITLYVEAVFPGEFGTPQRWYFPVTFQYWFGKPKIIYIGQNPFKDDSNSLADDHPDLNPGIVIKNLHKMFSKKVAVKNLTLTIYDDQITVLLGHNGAGKTSTMAMITGIIPATSGTAIVHGFDIKTNLKDVRSNLGLCPQHNILFDDLTVEEHLFFFSKLKGVRPEHMEEEIDKYLKLLELERKAEKKSSTLSGGMKRKLCVGIALCGSSKVVLLDEPTAGMDPCSRRALWDLLQKQKFGRCILLTTHYMDEADLLGDRIAIMANGELKCCGSGFYLKKKFGVGYHLILDKAKSCDVEAVTMLLKKFIPDLEIHRNLYSELVFLLKEDYVNVFEEMLFVLEENIPNLGIRSYGISLTTLEDVFIKVGADMESVKTEDTFSNSTKSKPVEFSLHSKLPGKKSRILDGYELVKNQYLAMLLKKLTSIKRNWVLFLIQILLPVSFMLIAIFVSRNFGKNKNRDLPKLELSLDLYQNPITLVQNNDNSSFATNYLKNLQGYPVEIVENITARMLNLTQWNQTSIKKTYLVGISFRESVATAWFNNDPYHTPALSLALLVNAFYQTYLGQNFSISFSNHPFPFTSKSRLHKLLRGNSIGFQIAFNLGFSMTFVSSFYILFSIKERVTKSKHLQFASGVNSFIFWTSSFVCDLLTFMATSLVIITVLACFQEEGFMKPGELARTFFVLFYFGFAMLPMTYIASYFFRTPATGYTRMTLFNVFTGVAGFLIVQILGSPGMNLNDVADGLHWGLLLSPHYSLSTSIRDNYISYMTHRSCEFLVKSCEEIQHNLTLDDCWNLACNNKSMTCCEKSPQYFAWTKPGIGKNVLYSFFSGTILFMLIIIMEHKFFTKAIYSICKKDGKSFTIVPDEDGDVVEEKNKIHLTPEYQLLKENSLVLKDVTKYYQNFLAVNGICLSIKQFECFGLLGVNGAGKTTTFKIITGDLNVTCGNVWVEGFSVRTHLKQVQKFIGYCPQFDALLVDLTAEETLIMFSLLRGIPLKECRLIAKKLAQDFDLSSHLYKKVKALSGGNKRKLSTAISLIGDPPIICLDEPTAGMDPVTKRHLWNALCTVRDHGKCILLTSHSMEECEALCTRLAIMVNGNFQCLGSAQHLKNKYADGYTLTIKLKRSMDFENQINKVQNFISEKFPAAKQQDSHQELITYHIVDKEICWSRLFGILESAKDWLNIEDYSLGQATLEQIFLSLTQHQR